MCLSLGYRLSRPASRNPTESGSDLGVVLEVPLPHPIELLQGLPDFVERCVVFLVDHVGGSEAFICASAFQVGVGMFLGRDGSN